MASEQLVRRENTPTEREVVEKDKVPMMTTHFEHLVEHAKESDITGGMGMGTSQGSIEALQGREHAGKAIGDVGGRGKARETHELGAHFESLADKVKSEDHKEKKKDHAANIVGNKESEREGRGGVRDVGKFEMKTEAEEKGNKDREELERQTREVKGREEARVGAENEGCTLEKGNSTEKASEESERDRSTWEQISNYRDQATETVKERYERAKQAASETLSNTTQTATQAKDATLEKSQQGYAATKDTVSSAAKTASEKTSLVAEKAKDVTVEGGKSAAEYAAKVAADLKDKAIVAGWAAAHFSTEKTVAGTKAAAHVVEGAAGYVGHKAFELASMSAGAVKGLAASAGETAKGYTARKKEEAQRELEAKKASQKEGTGSNVLTAIGESVRSAGQKVKKPFESIMGGEGKKESGKGNEKSGVQEEGKSVIGQYY